MVAIDQFPIFKLATLIARQLSSPIAARIKEFAKTHPRFRRAVCITTGQFYRNAELRFKMWSLNLGRPIRLPPLSEREAIDIGGNILGEFILFFIGSCIIIFEVNRQAENQETKKLAKRSEWIALKLNLEEIKKELELQQHDIDRLINTLSRLQSDKLGKTTEENEISDNIMSK